VSTIGLQSKGTPAIDWLEVTGITQCWPVMQVAKYNFFILEVQKAWITPSTKRQRTIHDLGKGAFMVAGRTIKLPSKMK